MMVGIVLVSFTLLSTAFMLLSYRYLITEMRQSMELNAGYVANFTAAYHRENRDISDSFYLSYIDSIALVSNSFIIVASADGEILYATDGVINSYHYADPTLPASVCQSIREQGSYSGVSDLGGIYPERRAIAGRLISAAQGGYTIPQWIVLVSADTSSISEMWRATATIFFFSAVVVMLIAVIASSIYSSVQARPLNDMAEAARKFGQGDFSVRVKGYAGHYDEIGTLAEAFNSMANSLEKVESHRSEFIANVSHELKTPMTTIAGFAEGILDGTIPPQRQKESLEVIVSETRRLSRLVRRMLDVSRLSAMAETVTAQEQFDLVEIMSRVLISLEGKITARNLDVDAQLPEEPVMVWGEPDAITQVCYNLLDNAAKFAAPGSTLTITMVKKDTKVYTTVRNLGATIPPNELPLLFERFHKADTSRSMDRDGVGLGLYIVKTILGSLKETISVTSEDGVTAFTFTLTQA